MSAPETSAADPLIGQVVDGRYHIRRILGRGGMGVVYEAEAIRLARRPCAVKVLLQEFTSSETAVARFSREADLASRVKHPNVVEIFDTGTTADGRGYIAMELLRGESLDRTLRREGPLPWGRARHVLTQICHALAVAHAERIMHRDMKPENCFRGERGGDPDFITVLDFGIAKLNPTEGEEFQRLTATHAVIGTYAYMANEQVRGEEIDHRVDVWALGVMLYEMLTGKLPFRGTNPGQIWTAICNYDPEPMRNIAPRAGIPEAAEAIIRRALARDRNDRFPTVDALAHALAEVHADLDVPRTPIPPALTPEQTISPTFVSGPTVARGQGPQSSISDPVSPHGLTEQSVAESAGTPESQPTRSPQSTQESSPLRLTPPREVLEIGAVDLAHEPAPALPAQPPAAPQGAIWLLSVLGLSGLALALWLSQGPAAPPPPPMPTPNLAIGPTLSEPPVVLSIEPQIVAAPEIETLSIRPLTPEPDPPKRPDKPLLRKPKKTHDSYRSRVTRELARVASSSTLADCFGPSTAPLPVDIKISATTGAARVTIPPIKQNSVLDICIQRIFTNKTFPTGGPDDADFEAKQYLLNQR